MAKAQKVGQKSGSRRLRVNPYPMPTCRSKVLQQQQKKKLSKVASEKKEWADAICSVCMEYPHNAVLLLCSSYHKGCRPYMCATSYRYSNCLDQYKKAYSTDSEHACLGSMEGSNLELMCPLCRGQVKGWTVVERARKYLNSKKRSCMQDNCSFIGTYKQLRKHVKGDHPWGRPREVDPTLAEKWKKLENEREVNDVMSTMRPGSIIVGDYVIEGNFSRDLDVDEYMGNLLFRLEPYGRGNSDGLFERRYQSWDEEDEEFGIQGDRGVDNFFSRIGDCHSRVLLGGGSRRRRRRRRRRREGNGGR